MMLLILLNVLMMTFFALPWLSENGGQNFLTGQYTLSFWNVGPEVGMGA
jgi:hypothetical protein